jgi:hypothetical protein
MNRAVLIPALFALSAFAPSEKQAAREEFIAISDGKRVFVNWTSSNDRNYDYFTIEKSKDGVNFSASLIVKGVGGVPGLEYFDCDYAPYEGMSYYRLKQTDYYGDYVYSGVVPVNFQLLKDGTIITAPKLPDTSELEELQTRETLVVLQDKQGARHVSKVRVLHSRKQDCPSARCLPGNRQLQ